MHSYRHTFASRWLLAGESVDEVAFLLGHRDGNVTRDVYLREAQTRAARPLDGRWVAAEYGTALEAAASPVRAAERNESGIARPLRAHHGG
jgi:hypothetical protein